MAQPSRTTSPRITSLGEERPRQFAAALRAIDRDLSEGPLADILGLARTDGGIIVGDGSNFVLESGATARASLGLTIGTDVQAFGAVLDDFNTLGAAASDGQFIVATGAGAFAYESGTTVRTSLGLGTSDDVTFNSVADTNGDLRGVRTDATTSGSLAASDADSRIFATGNITVTDDTFAAGDTIHIINHSASSITLTQDTSMTLYNTADGGTGNLTLSARGSVLLAFQAQNVCYATGNVS